MSLKDKIDTTKLPCHIAIIMDGNGRWAKKKGNARLFGHTNGVKAVREVVEASAELGIKYLTLYAFSTENWNRPKIEIEGLMSLLVASINNETKKLMENNIRLLAIGNLEDLPGKVLDKLNESIKKTENNTGMSLVLALSYSARWEIVDAVRKMVEASHNGTLLQEDISEKTICNFLTTGNIPDPELLIRTSGEFRVSNFLLWQIAYTELYFTDKLWPDFCKEDLFLAILDFQSRERRFGKISEQINR